MKNLALKILERHQILHHPPPVPILSILDDYDIKISFIEYDIENLRFKEAFDKIHYLVSRYRYDTKTILLSKNLLLDKYNKKNEFYRYSAIYTLGGLLLYPHLTYSYPELLNIYLDGHNADEEFIENCNIFSSYILHAHLHFKNDFISKKDYVEGVSDIFKTPALLNRKKYKKR